MATLVFFDPIMRIGAHSIVEIEKLTPACGNAFVENGIFAVRMHSVMYWQLYICVCGHCFPSSAARPSEAGCWHCGEFHPPVTANLRLTALPVEATKFSESPIPRHFTEAGKLRYFRRPSAARSLGQLSGEYNHRTEKGLVSTLRAELSRQLQTPS